jgi:hypothetical protein
MSENLSGEAWKYTNETEWNFERRGKVVPIGKKPMNHTGLRNSRRDLFRSTNCSKFVGLELPTPPDRLYPVSYWTHH